MAETSGHAGVEHPLHKSPRGLLELFRLRTLGRQPDRFGDTVVPVVEVGEFYAADLKLVSTPALTTGAIGGAGMSSTLTLTGPIRVHAAGAVVVCGAAAMTNVTVTVEVLRQSPAGPPTLGCPLVSYFFPAINAGARVGVGVPIGRSWVLLPGAAMGIIARISGTAAGADHTVQASTLIDNITGTA